MIHTPLCKIHNPLFQKSAYGPAICKLESHEFYEFFMYLCSKKIVWSQGWVHGCSCRVKITPKPSINHSHITKYNFLQVQADKISWLIGTWLCYVTGKASAWGKSQTETTVMILNFSDRQVRANSVDPDQEQSDQGLHRLPFRLHLLDPLFYGKGTLLKF